MKNNYSTPSFLWPLLTLICLIVIGYGLFIGLQKTNLDQTKKNRIFQLAVIGVLIWILLITFLSIQGFFADFSHLPPRPALVILIPLVWILWIVFSRNGTALLKNIPPHWLIFIQSFRIIVELLIWFAFLADKLPIQMTFEGRNFDVFSGMLALPVGYLVMKKKSYSSVLILIYNIIGIALLLNILIVAMLSFPTSFRYFMNEPSNAIIARFPYILLPSVLVPIAYSFHIFSLRQWFISRKEK
jgi:hypothetical protein